jgi:hypothetical protein
MLKIVASPTAPTTQESERLSEAALVRVICGELVLVANAREHDRLLIAFHEVLITLRHLEALRTRIARRLEARP